MIKLQGRAIMTLLEHAYDVHLDENAWSEGLVEAVMELSGGVASRMFRLHSAFQPDGSLLWTPVGDLRCKGGDQRWDDLRNAPVFSGPYAEVAFGRTVGMTYSARTGLEHHLSETPGWRETWPDGVNDALGLISRDAHGDVLAVTAGITQVHAMDPRGERLLTKLATHLGTADRLRRLTTSIPAHADAVFDANARLVHARDPRPDTQTAIDDGLQRRAFARENRDAPEKALEVWQGLVAGLWSLVDFFDTDGKRFVLAMKNPPKVDRRADLTPRERRVASLVAMGHSDKETAYMLGLSVATVSTALRRARIKLDVHTRAELAAVWRKSQ